MRIGIIGRTKILLDVAEKLLKHGFEIPFLYTCKAENFYNCDEKEYQHFAESIGADFYYGLGINSPETVSQLSQYQCDVAFSLNWLTVLKDDICRVFKNGIYNAHPGDLPRYRGNACPNWAILNGENFIGLTIHEIEPNKLDSGDIIAKEYLSINQDSYIADVYAWLEQKIPEMYLNVAYQLKEDKIVKKKQSANPDDILRCYPRKPEDSRILWNQSAELIHRLIRASSYPFSGAFCYLESGEIIRVWSSELVKHHGAFSAVPGQVLYAEDGSPVICCLDSIIKLTKVTNDANDLDVKTLILKSLRNRLR